MIRRMGLIAMALMMLIGAGRGLAQQGDPFAPRLIVNDKAITNYEYEQRVRFLRLLGSPPNVQKLALDGLVDDRLRTEEANRLGITVSEEDLTKAMDEFAARANLSTEQFISALGQEGVSAETFRDFIRAGVVWRQVVQTRFGPRAQVTEAEIDRALAASSRGRGAGGTQVLLSEIVLRADTPEYRSEAQALADQLSESIRSETQFASAAREYSVSRSRDQGGRMGWMPLSNLPPEIATQVLTLGPGQVSSPIELQQAVVLFQLRAIREGAPTAPGTLSVDYAEFRIPGGTLAEAMKVRMRADTCDDLYGIAKGLPEDRLVRETRPVRELPPAIAKELEKLDENEVSYGLSTPQMAVVLMLCERTPDLGEEEVDREAVRRRLLNQRLAGYADSYLAEIKADAIIREP